MMINEPLFTSELNMVPPTISPFAFKVLQVILMCNLHCKPTYT